MEKNNIFKIINYEFQGLQFLIRNLRESKSLTPMVDSKFDNYLLTGLPPDRLSEMNELHKLVREGRSLNFWRKTYLKFRGSCVCCIAINDNNELIGFNYYYFRTSEFNDGIIHDAYLGISPKAWGQGLGTALQTYAVRHLSLQKLTGISGNVAKGNHASVKMLNRVGFKLFDDPDDLNNHIIFFKF